MAITRVGASQGTSNVSAATLGLTRTAGAINNLLVVTVFSAARTNAPSVSDTQGNTWNVCNPDFNDATNGTRMASWYALAKNTSSTTVTVANNSGANFIGMTLEEFTGNDTTTPLDQVNHSTAGATGTNPTGPSITLGANDCLVWALHVDNTTGVGNIDGSVATKGSDDGSSDWSEFRVLTGRTGVAVNAAWTSTGAYDDFIASFKPAVSALTVAQEIGIFVQEISGQMVGVMWR